MKRTDVMANAMGAINIRALLPFSWLWALPFPPFLKEKQAFSILENVFGEIIADHQKENSQENSMEQSEEFQGTDMVTLLLQTKEQNDPRKYPYSHKEMLSECFSLFLAGQETTTPLTMFVLYEIANKPEVQKKIREEIKLIAKDNGEDNWKNYRPVYADYNKMKFIENVVKETERLYPILPSIPRMTTEDDRYENIFIPKGVRNFLESSQIKKFKKN